MSLQRSSGVLLHVTSLPGRYGVGSLNRSAYAWVDFLADAGQTVWQVLPLGPTSYGDSPYASLSTFAGNPYLIGLESLVDDGLASPEDLEDAPELPHDKVDYSALSEWKLPLLARIAGRWVGRAPDEFHAWAATQSAWLPDYALFLALKSEHENKNWQEWPDELKTRQPAALAEARDRHAERIEVEQIIQWFFFRQWNALRAYANERKVKVFGDIPIFVAMDSSDTWCNPGLFQLDPDLKPTHVAGVPPDYFSPTGQLWGNPLYAWPAHAESGYAWWIERVRAAFTMYDILRIDHFRGFAAYWSVPAGSETAELGSWVKGPGAEFFQALRNALGEREIVAEDLGDITPDVTALRDQFQLPGMKIVQFAFGSDASNPFLPHNFESTRFVAYTGTHDNDTVRGWFETAQESEKRYAREYFGFIEESITRTLVRATMASVAQWAIVPLQDLLDLDGSARMNYPGRAHDNWGWRLQPGQLTPHHQGDLLRMTRIYNRLRLEPALVPPAAV